MKALLKLLGTITLATTPVITVVGCGSENKHMTRRDILNSAASFISDSNVKLKADLNLPDDTKIGLMEGKTFSKLDNCVQKAISTFFSSKLKKSTNHHPTNWYYHDAHVIIMDYVPKKDHDSDEANKPNFVLPTGSELVNGHLWVKAEISYANLPSVTKDIKITINNDTSHSNDQIKANAIKDFIKKEINHININVENLPISGEITTVTKEQKDSQNKAKTQLSYIQQNLNVAIKDKVQYYALKLGFEFTGDFSSKSKSTLFTMTPSTLNKDDNSIVFNGNVNNITISFLVGNGGKAEFNINDENTAAIKINQTFVDATTQISKIFSDWTFQSTLENLPQPSQSFSQYAQAEAIKKEVITKGYFANINKIYSELASNWQDNVITITNPESVFNLDPNRNSGYFNLNFKLEYDLKNILSATSSKFNINEVTNIKLRKSKN